MTWSGREVAHQPMLPTKPQPLISMKQMNILDTAWVPVHLGTVTHIWNNYQRITDEMEKIKREGRYIVYKGLVLVYFMFRDYRDIGTSIRKLDSMHKMDQGVRI